MLNLPIQLATFSLVVSTLVSLLIIIFLLEVYLRSQHAMTLPQCWQLISHQPRGLGASHRYSPDSCGRLW